MEKVLSVKNVSKKIGKKQILDDVSLDVYEGEIFGFVGPNGAGKTTLIKTMLGLYKAQKGTIEICGYDIKKDFEEAMDLIGAIIENPEMYYYLSGKDNLNIYKRLENITDSEVEKIIEQVKLKTRINDKVRTYSLGMRQRLGLAQSLLTKPKLLILDEPTNGLDPLGIKELREILMKISKDDNITVFISSHILSEIELICDRIAIFDNGKIIEIKDMKDEEEEKLVEVSFKIDRLKDDKEQIIIDNLVKKDIHGAIEEDILKLQIKREDIPKINKFLVSKDINIYEIKINHKSLEDEFIEKTSGTKGQIR